MTTIVGITTNKEEEKRVILASDISQTSILWDNRGDVAYKHQSKSETEKIHIDKNEEVVIAMSGVYDDLYIDFLHKVLADKIDIKKAVKNNFFQELQDLHLKRWNGIYPQDNSANSLLLATRFDNKPELYTCFPLGKLDKREWSSIGSGSQYAINYISKQGLSVPPHLTINEGLDLVVASLNEASQDIYTGGLDVVVISPDKIENYGRKIKEDMDLAKQKSIESIKKSIQKQYSKNSISDWKMTPP
ncbi:MAG: hypothetical protein KJ583_06550 [Nanoarchaeota archaeon]|nr:hypothetical protein [Nanoarchaeota archaeon]MBU1269050.1 hypothetical protein [Nanoarchaeota archaeon]MBU1604945.1 hypothetical protein [Nanoarchaeota archaeon]MBU2443325.1 hypothetical protein [Nanoarchaeota archaeon]